MAAVVVTNSNVRVEDAESTTGWTSDGGGGAGPQDEPDFFYQNTQGVSRKVGATKGGHGYTPTSDGGAALDMTVAADNTAILKGIWTNKDILVAAPSATFKIGSSSSAYYEFNVADDGTQGDIDYPLLGGWLLVPINPNITAWRSAVSGSPTLSAVDWWSIQGDFSTSSKSENVVIDAIDVGPGLWLVGGDGGTADATFQDFLDADEGQISTGRWGHIVTVRGGISVLGTLVIGRNASGTVTATGFTDADKNIIFPRHFADAGWTGLEIDAGNASTVVTWDRITFKGEGKDNLNHFFDSISQIDATNDEIDITGHGYLTGNAVVYSDEGGTDTIGLTDTNEYFVGAITADAIAFYSTKANAHADTSRVVLSAGSGGENHKITRQPDIRPDLTVTGASGDFLPTACSFITFRTLTFTAAAAVADCTFIECGSIALGAGTLNGCVILNQTTSEGEPLITASTLDANITGCDFELASDGEGHAIEIDTAGSFAFNDNTFTGYGPNRAQFTTDSGGIDAGTEVITTDELHGFVDGDVVYYNDEGGAASIGLTDGNKYYVNSITTQTLSLHRSRNNAVGDTNRINLSTSGAETHSLYSGKAAVYNSTSSGTVTINVTTGGTPTVRNAPGATTSVLATKTLTITVQDPDQVAVVGASVYIQLAAGPFDDDSEIMRELTNGSGVATEPYNYTGDVNVIVRVRKKGYVFEKQNQIIDSNGLSLTVTLRPDPTQE